MSPRTRMIVATAGGSILLLVGIWEVLFVGRGFISSFFLAALLFTVAYANRPR